MFENSFLAMFIFQVSSKLRDKYCQITRISILICKHCFMGQYIELVIILPYSVVMMQNKPCWNSKSIGVHLAHAIRILKIKHRTVASTETNDTSAESLGSQLFGARRTWAWQGQEGATLTCPKRHWKKVNLTELSQNAKKTKNRFNF